MEAPPPTSPPPTPPPSTWPALTCLYAAGFRAQVRQVDVGLPPVNDGVGVLAGSLGRPSVRHGDLKTQRGESSARDQNNHQEEENPPSKMSAAGCFHLFYQNQLLCSGFALKWKLQKCDERFRDSSGGGGGGGAAEM